MGIQVTNATKDREGHSLPIIARQFISFSYGEKLIEDFGLLIVFNNDRLEKNIYSTFEDTVTQQAELDGQLFWRSKFNANEINFTLATDGMTARQLEDFKQWFIPGVERELVLTEHSNRGIKARVASAPNFSLLPFEHQVEVKIGGETQITKTSLYKGNVTISFIADEPTWYARTTQLGETFKGNIIKIIYEDNIPHIKMFHNIPSCLVAKNYYYDGEKFVDPPQSITLDEDDSTNVNNQQNYLYYCGTALSYPTLTFSITPIIEESTGIISFPRATRFVNDEDTKISLSYIDENKDINYSQDFLFSLPSLYSSYNQALQIVSDFIKGSETSILTLRNLLRDSIYNYYTRAWVMAIIDLAQSNTNYCNTAGEVNKTNFSGYFINSMKNFIQDNDGNIHHLKCTFNSKTGVSTLKTSIRVFKGGNSLTNFSIKSITENAGDMVKSKYLIIEDIGIPKRDVNGNITTDNCYVLTTNSRVTELSINFNYRYL